MPPSPPEYPITHIYAPRFPHELVEIIGNQPGLERLIRVLTDAVGEGRANGRISSSDHVESEVRATCLRGRRRPEEWRRAGSPLWEEDDPLVARILELTRENHQLRRKLRALRGLRQLSQDFDLPGGDGDEDETTNDPMRRLE
jgi:hypothetical protein